MEPNQGHSQGGGQSAGGGTPANAQSQTPATAGNPLVPAAATAVIPAALPETNDSPEEQAWIEKAKMVIARSAGDPYTKHEMLSQLKTQYLKQRFGKEIGEEKS